MKVFISWSKNSRDAGRAVSTAVSEIFAPVVTTFISQEIRAGSRALEEIDDALDNTDFGIICLTRSNQTEQWINYEAGALSRQVENKRQRMGVLLVDFESVDEVNSPMNIFQCKMATLQGFSELMLSLNELSPNVKEDTLSKRINLVWPDVEKEIQAVKEAKPQEDLPDVPVKTADDKLDELLSLVKVIESSIGDEVSARKGRGNAITWGEYLSKADPHARKAFLSHAAGDELGAEWITNMLVSSRERSATRGVALEKVTDNVLKELRKHTELGRVSIGMAEGEYRIRTDAEVPMNLQNLVIAQLDPFYPVENIVFLPNSFGD
ncbi:TIR domain-containing protein [Arthrobacter sp. ISL-28]|uniref:TIR domain-containing protein n=1 Tax=Arthrobacter sp. ISL-28 TaxID=2819108 RepID=UPI001BEB4144|nr:TIR domain-containing protein [Arthrobacter sp. ISL-28]MBT2521809.1 toll/interleukin-1 receptor domain-containing protein [Arthrobacter sp. ISL-28]